MAPSTLRQPLQGPSLRSCAQICLTGVNCCFNMQRLWISAYFAVAPFVANIKISYLVLRVAECFLVAIFRGIICGSMYPGNI